VVAASPPPAVRSPTPPGARQQSFDDLGTPLHDVTFVVVDLETTGASPSDCAITEVGAVRYRAGECLGTFQTLVNPGVPVPPFITVLTGITEAMVLPAPRIAEVLPALLEFVGGAVVVGHNVRFDVAFLDAALLAHGYSRLGHRRVDTIGLARRLLRDDVPNLRLSTLARHLRTSVEPCHRALDDARATAEVLHALLERAAAFGVLGLDDLLALPTIRAHPSASKLSLTARLPRGPGVYLFRDRAGRVLYVGKATNLRARVRSYFGGDDRRKVPQLLRETAVIDHIECAHPLEAAVRELRLIREHAPRFNRRAKGAGRSYAYLKLTLDERFPRLAVVRAVRDDGALYLGPLHSAAAAHVVREAIEAAAPLRRCAQRIGHTTPIGVDTPCVPAQLGVACCPCRGHTTEPEYSAVVGMVVRGLRDDPASLIDPLEDRMRALAEAERFEEAAATRDRLAALTRALARQRTCAQLRAAGRLRIELADGAVEIVNGRLVLDHEQLADAGALTAGLTAERMCERPPGRDEVDELLVVGRWLEQAAGSARVRLAEATGALASPLPALRVYDGAPRRPVRPGR
jgi:DNA polymerase III subunit epsilon